jgi:hypothetical protein
MHSRAASKFALSKRFFGAVGDSPVAFYEETAVKWSLSSFIAGRPAGRKRSSLIGPRPPA